MSSRLVVAAASLSLLAAATAARAAPEEPGAEALPPLHLVVSAAASPRGDAIADAATAAVMRQAGRRYTLSREPVARALASFQAGQYDADMLRIPTFDRLVPGAVRVDPHLLSTTIQAFSRSPSVSPASWAELNGLRVAHVRGVKVMEQGLAGHPDVEVTNSAAACLGMVAMQRADVCLLNAEHDYGPPPRVDGVQLHRTVLARLNLHIWVAPGPNAAALAQQLSAAVRRTLASGELTRIAGGNRQP
jgi:ABC-type amino acid transport substrate-binding protein